VMAVSKRLRFEVFRRDEIAQSLLESEGGE
jgi:hypothetical protein